MRDSFSCVLLVLLTTNTITALETAKSRRKTEVLDEPLASVRRKLAAVVDHSNNAALKSIQDDWTSQVTCSIDADSEEPSLIDQEACKTRLDDNSGPCVWCAISFLGSGQGVCVSEDQKQDAGEYWGMICDDTSVATASPTPKPTPAPVAGSDDEAGSDDSFNGIFDCAADSSHNIITNEEACVSQVDQSSASGEHCVWCPIPFLGGTCISNSIDGSVGNLCSQLPRTPRKSGQLRSVQDWNQLDPSCLGESGTTGFGGDKEGCLATNDLSGNPCIWCDGAGVLGMCVTSLQKVYLSDHMDCGDSSLQRSTLVMTE